MTFQVRELINGNIISFELDWSEAEDAARKSSSGHRACLIIDNETGQTEQIFYNGCRYELAKDTLCEGCGKRLKATDEVTSYSLTSHYFCSTECGLQIGALKVYGPGGEAKS